MMDKAVLTVWAVYLVGFALYPLMEGLADGFSLSRKRCSNYDHDLEMFLMIVKSVFWPVVVIGWLWALWVEILGGADEWVHDKLAENKHKEDK